MVRAPSTSHRESAVQRPGWQKANWAFGANCIIFECWTTRKDAENSKSNVRMRVVSMHPEGQLTGVVREIIWLSDSSMNDDGTCTRSIVIDLIYVCCNCVHQVHEYV